MFTLFAVLLGLIPEPLEILIFAIALVLLTIGLRWLMKRSEKGTTGDIKHTTK